VAVLAASALAVVAGHRRGRIVAIALLVAAVTSPGARAFAIVRLLAREDTRVAAGAHLHPTGAKALPLSGPNSYPAYASPVLPLTAGSIAWRLDADVRQRLAERTRARDQAVPVAAYRDGVPESLAKVAERGGLVVTVASPHPTLEHWASTAPATTDFL